MDSGTGFDVTSPAALRSEIEQTRSAIGAKLAKLQEGVRDTFSEASGQVRTSLEHAKESVNPRAQFHQHPWAFCAAAFACGVLLQRRAISQRASRDDERGAPDYAAGEAPMWRQGWRRRGTAAPIITGTVVPIVAEALRALIERSRRSRP